MYYTNHAAKLIATQTPKAGTHYTNHAAALIATAKGTK